MSCQSFLKRLVFCLILVQLVTCAVLKSDNKTPKGKKPVTQAGTSTSLQAVPLSSTTSSSKAAKPTHAKSSVTSCPIKRHGLFKRACSRQSDGPWALQRISQTAPLAWANPKAIRDGISDWEYEFTYDQKWGQNAYVIDTGVNGAHRAFQKDQVEKGESIASVKQSQGIESNPFTDTENHGTGVASVIGGQETGIARSVKIFPIKVSNAAVSVSQITIIEGINIAVKDWTARSAKNTELRAVINISSSFSYYAPMQVAFQLAEKAGMLIVHAAANERTNTCDNRANNAGQILVASVKPVFDRTPKLVDEYHPLMGYGPCIDICAPGVFIWAADNDNGEEVTKDGSSFATPLVSGVVAALLSSHKEYRNLKPPEFKRKFLQEFSMSDIHKLPPGTPDRMLIITELLKIVSGSN